ncbi:hypothetical protein [Magnetovibrio blakemorei]|nr:hypothetical protein [Magnetovibrio blakemorei]
MPSSPLGKTDLPSATPSMDTEALADVQQFETSDGPASQNISK